MRSQTSDIPREDRNAVADAVTTAALTGDPATTHILNEIAAGSALGW